MYLDSAKMDQNICQKYMSKFTSKKLVALSSFGLVEC